MKSKNKTKRKTILVYLLMAMGMLLPFNFTLLKCFSLSTTQ